MVAFVYELLDLETGMWYVGSRTAKNCHFEQLGLTYFTSSKYVEPLFKLNPSRFSKTLLFSSENCDEVVRIESEILKCRNAKDDVNSYNCHNGSKDFNAKKCSVLTWSKPEHRENISRKAKELMKTDVRKEQISKAKEMARSADALYKLSNTHKELAKTPERRKQLERAWESAHKEESKSKRTFSMRSYFLENKQAALDFQKAGSSAHFEKLKTDEEYARLYSEKLKAGWIKRKAKNDR